MELNDSPEMNSCPQQTRRFCYLFTIKAKPRMNDFTFFIIKIFGTIWILAKPQVFANGWPLHCNTWGNLNLDENILGDNKLANRWDDAKKIKNLQTADNLQPGLKRFSGDRSIKMHLVLTFNCWKKESYG